MQPNSLDMTQDRIITSEIPQPRDAWDTLSMKEKAEMIGVAVRNGITSLKDIRQKYNEFAEGGDTNPYTVGNIVDALYASNPREEYLGEPSHHYDFTQSEEWANAHGYYPDARGHRDDRVKKPAHPSHPSRGTWNGDKFELTDLGMQNPNYTLFGLTDGGQDPQAVLTYQGGTVLPEVTVTPNENYFYNPYDNIILHQKANGGKIHIKPSKRGTFTAAAKKHGKSVQAFASQVLAHPENYSPAMRKKANFARNASRWKHGLGGNLFDGTSQPTQKMQKASDYRYVLDDDGEWNRVANDEMGRVFQGLTVTPAGESGQPAPARYRISYDAGVTKDDAAPIRNLFSKIQEVADTPIMVQQNPGTATGYSSYGQYMPKSQSTYGDQADLLLAEVTAPTMLSDAKGIYQVFRHPAQTGKAIRSIFSESTPAEWAKAENSSEDLTDNLLRWLGKPLSYKPDRTVEERLDNLPSGYRKMANILAENGVDLSRIGVKDLQKAKKLRLSSIESTAPNRYTLAVPTDKGYDLRDMIGSKDTGFDDVGLTELTLRPDRNTSMDMVQNLSRNPLTGEQTVHGVYKRGLNAAINTAQSEGGRGVVSGKLLISAPRQYPVIQQFKGRKVLGWDATHTNTNLVPNVYEAGASGVKDAESMLELRRAGKSTAKSLSNAPYWLLPNATEHIPTKSVLFNPTIIDKFGKMHIDWNDPNIFKGIAYPTIFGSTLYNLNNE